VFNFVLSNILAKQFTVTAVYVLFKNYYCLLKITVHSQTNDFLSKISYFVIVYILFSAIMLEV